MDPSHHRRKADQERRRLREHEKKKSDAERKLHEAERKAADAEARARKARTDSQASPKQREVERHKKSADTARRNIESAVKAIESSRKKLDGHESSARRAEEQLARKQEAASKREEREARRKAAREARERREAERADAAERIARERHIDELREKTEDLEQGLEAARLEAPETITVLFIAGALENEEGKALHLDRELREVGKRIGSATHGDQIYLQHLMATQIRDIIDGLNQYGPDVVHFLGHGSENSLLFDGPDGEPHELLADELGLLLQVAAKPIRLAVFNSCMSAEQADMATDYIDAAIGMEREIGDEVAKEFSGQLYASLGEGNSLAVSFNQAKAQAEVLRDEEEGPGEPAMFTGDGTEAEAMVLVAPGEGVGS